MLYARMAAAFEDIKKPMKVALQVSVRVCQRVSNACLGGKVYDIRWLAFFEQIADPFVVCEIELSELKVLKTLQYIQPAEFQLYIVVVIDDVPSSRYANR